MRIALCLIVIWALLLTVGCKSSPSLVGTWEAEGKPSTFTFNTDGTFSVKNLHVGGVSTISTGTYTVDGDILSMTTKKSALASMDPKLQPQIDKLNANEALAQSATQQFKLLWGSKDQIDLLSPGADASKTTGVSLTRTG